MDSFIGYFQDRGVEIPRASLNSVRQVVLRYIFRLIGSTEFKKTILKLSPASDKSLILKISRDILKNGYIMKNIKLWLYCLSYHNLAGSRKRKEVADDFKILEQDYGLINVLRSIPEISKLHKYPSMELHEFDEVVGNQLRKLKPYIGKFVNKKMKYIQMFHTLSSADLCSDLMYEAIAVVMFYYPRIQNTQHLENIMKVKVRNTGCNMMDWYGNTKRCVELHRTINDSSMDALLEHEIVTDDHITKQVVTKLLMKYTDKRRDFLNLIMHYNKEFSDWLHERGVKLPNDELLERGNHKNYINYVLDYLEVDREAAQPFINQIKSMIE